MCARCRRPARAGGEVGSAVPLGPSTGLGRTVCFLFMLSLSKHRGEPFGHAQDRLVEP